jgi:hypothetical protein
MSMHIACNGYSNDQRNKSKKDKSEESKENSSNINKPEWQSEGSLNNLKDVYELYFPEKNKMSKDERNIFIKGNVDDVINNFQVK